MIYKTTKVSQLAPGIPDSSSGLATPPVIPNKQIRIQPFCDKFTLDSEGLKVCKRVEYDCSGHIPTYKTIVNGLSYYCSDLEDKFDNIYKYGTPNPITKQQQPITNASCATIRCAQGYKCSQGQCIRNPTCQTDTDCSSEQYCQIGTNVCRFYVTRGNECDNSVKCTPGLDCLANKCN